VILPPRLGGGPSDLTALFRRKIRGTGYATLKATLATESDGMGVLAAFPGLWVQWLTNSLLHDMQGTFHGV